MRAGRGDFAGRPQAVERGAAVRVGRDAAHVVVRGRRDRDRLARRIDAGAAAVFGDGGKALRERRADRLAGIEERAASGLQLGEHAARHDIARRKLGLAMDRQHEALARAVDQRSRLRRGSPRSRAAPDRGRCRSRSDGTGRTPDRRCTAPARAAMREAVPARLARIGGHRIEMPEPAGGEHDRARRNGRRAARRAWRA